jgi:hypothetical protein
MMKTLLFALTSLFLLGFSAVSEAQSIPATLNWVNPTTAVDTTPLTGIYSLTKIQLFVSTAPMKVGATDPILIPYLEVLPVSGVMPSNNSYTLGIPPKTTLYFRGRACNVNGCSNFSVEASRLNPGTTSLPVTITLPTISSP